MRRNPLSFNERRDLVSCSPTAGRRARLSTTHPSRCRKQGGGHAGKGAGSRVRCTRLAVQGAGSGELALANVLVLAVLVDDRESSPGALGKFVEILVGTRLHQRDAVDLDAL